MSHTGWVQTSDLSSVLLGSTLFRSLDREALTAVAASCTHRRFVRGQYLFHQGDAGVWCVQLDEGGGAVVCAHVDE